MLISEDYRKQQAKMHAENAAYGTASLAHAKDVARVLNNYGLTSLLDYGAGKRRLLHALNGLVGHPYSYRAYEPSDPECSDPPEPADMVACLDVLEHIEPELLDNVLYDLQRVTRKVGLFTIGTEFARKTLPDGRNAHLIVEPMEWWLPKIWTRFEIHALQRLDRGFLVLVSARE